MPDRRSLIHRIVDVHNLYEAWDHVRKRRAASKGSDGVTIERFGRGVRSHLEDLRRSLQKGDFAFRPLVPIPVRKASGKIRPLQVPAVRDRVAMRAAYQILEPRIKGIRNACSFGYVAGRTVGDAVGAVRAWVRAGRTCVLEADIEKFFDTVDRERLLGMLREQFPGDEFLTQFLDKAVRLPLGDLADLSLEERAAFPGEGAGIPQGGGLSPLFANLYLKRFDQEMLRAGHALVRYADDFVVMATSREQARGAHAQARALLEDDLGLKMHPLAAGSSAKTRIRSVSKGFDFLGVRFQGEAVRPSRGAVGSFRDELAKIASDSRATLREVLQQLHYVTSGWQAAYSFCDGSELQSVFGGLNDDIRAQVSRALHRLGLRRDTGPIPVELARRLGVRLLAAPAGVARAAVPATSHTA